MSYQVVAQFSWGREGDPTQPTHIVYFVIFKVCVVVL